MVEQKKVCGVKLVGVPCPGKNECPLVVQVDQSLADPNITKEELEGLREQLQSYYQGCLRILEFSDVINETIKSLSGRKDDD